jgi:hypothetical protein
MILAATLMAFVPFNVQLDYPGDQEGRSGTCLLMVGPDPSSTTRGGASSAGTPTTWPGIRSPSGRAVMTGWS